MDEEEIEHLITELRALLDTNGFGWAREEAEASVGPGQHPRRIALALVLAAEDVTVNLAQAEFAIMATFDREVEFKPDENVASDVDDFSADDGADYSRRAPVERLRGDERLQVIASLTELHASFQELKGKLDGQF